MQFYLYNTSSTHLQNGVLKGGDVVPEVEEGGGRRTMAEVGESVSGQEEVPGSPKVFSPLQTAPDLQRAEGHMEKGFENTWLKNHTFSGVSVKSFI